jgi:Ran GTPase-activating protein (RanGAP) involved in mRNA processing and transport
MLIESIIRLPNIKEINLSNNDIGSNGITDIASYLTIMPQLKLDLCNNYIDRITRSKLFKKYNYYGLTI